MSYSVNYANLLSVSSALWLGAGGVGKRPWYDSNPSGKVTKVFPPSPTNTAIIPDTPPSPPPTPPSRPSLVRSCTSATLIDTDFLSAALPPTVSLIDAESSLKTDDDDLKRTELVDRLRKLLPAPPVPLVEDGHLGQDASVVNVAEPTPKPKVRRVKKKKTTKRRRRRTVRWSEDVIEREIQANRPITGPERLERFRRLGYTF